MQQFLTGFFLAFLISALAYRARSLNRSGTLAAFLLGTVVFGLGGLRWAVLLLGFFISSSALSRMFSQRKASLNEKFAKGSQRDAWQVLANGGMGGLFVLFHLAFPQEAWPWLGFAGSMAAVNADTWATELGVLSRSIPRLISNGEPVERGSSGGVTPEGTLAALAGGSFIALLATVLSPITFSSPFLALAAVAIAGCAASLVDSLLGATVQAIYRCPTCDKETERHPLHSCGTNTLLIRGLAWLNNDLVNMSCALTGGLLAAVVFSFL